ncbi:putative formate/nitrite transporter [Sistotremastrum niveocremeum HHB9708]|uniref:Putative formate/nitrite transporter n=2 Tax=Sistotremastraceae TaxID=3402574 RepID=A0A164MPT7_9AGAM|nr:putative formate/nitrite transporter [Sistotremastrum niveocremeum HHB9708]KZT39086.1 putative formate/nitrite transporter [Sistotremastrum suecicum HHB10207 ss-3]
MSTLTPAEVAVVMVETAVVKHNTRPDKVFAKAFIAGIFLSFGGLLSQVLSAGSPGLTASNPGMVKILSGFVFPVGLVMIVLQGQELLTSNMMTFPMAWIKRRIPWWSTPANWLIVFFGNLVGSLFFDAILVKYTAVVSTDPYLTGIREAAIKKAITPEWHQVFLRGIGCNFLVCIAVWQAAAAREVYSKVIAIWIPIWIFVACSYDHVVANMFLVPMGILLDAHEGLTTASYIRKSLIAAFIGNAVGALLVALPFTWFYLGDYRAGGMEDMEEGEAIAGRDAAQPRNDLVTMDGSKGSSINNQKRD